MKAWRMNGLFLQYYGEHEERAGWTERGWGIAYQTGGPMQKPYAAERAEQTLREIAEMIGERSRELHGFTLFLHEGKGWQMSVRRKDEKGWDVKIIPDEQAQAILSMLQASGHPDGPMAPILADREAEYRADLAEVSYSMLTMRLRQLLAKAAEARKANTAARIGR